MRIVGAVGVGAIVAVVGACSTEDTTPDIPTTTEDAGSAESPADAGQASSPEAAAPACLATGADCARDPSACCNGSTCVYNVADPSKSVCAANCLNGSQCASGCCTVLIEGSSAVCAPAAFCASACSQPGEGCASTTCCGNGVCVNSTVDGIRCAARCVAHAQCKSGCCAPLDNTGELVCSPPTFCQ